ncbi:hypothetical protein HU200_057593 [Digitaria exilis]|uniref:Uncharacterized protein n=1 Tax=Digitaria exilis TaxID=1010633 RepID=A0A835AH59_9POAL|nr:hypothetical protein HU200_057593 [Digitaria exilis]
MVVNKGNCISSPLLLRPKQPFASFLHAPSNSLALKHRSQGEIRSFKQEARALDLPGKKKGAPRSCEADGIGIGIVLLHGVQRRRRRRRRRRRWA